MTKGIFYLAFQMPGSLMSFVRYFLGEWASKILLSYARLVLINILFHSDPNKNEFSNSIMIQALRNTDERIKNNQSVTPGFLMAALLWPILISKCSKDGEVNIRKFFRSMDGVLREQQKLTAIPRKFNSYIKDIWVLQLKASQQNKKSALQNY